MINYFNNVFRILSLVWKLPRYCHTTGSFEFQFVGVQPFQPLHHCFALFGLKKWIKRRGQSQRNREDEYITDVSSDYIDICSGLMKPYISTYLLPCELEAHTSRGDYNCTEKYCWLWFPWIIFSPLLFAVHCQRILSRNLKKTRCILIQHFPHNIVLSSI